MNFRRSIRFVLSGFLLLALAQLAHARNELPKEVTDLFAKMDAAARKPFAEVATQTCEYVEKGKKKSMDLGSCSAIFIDPKRFQFQVDDGSAFQQMNLIGNGEKCFAYSRGSGSPLIYDDAPMLDAYYFQRLCEYEPNLAIAICGSSQSVLMTEQSEFVELKDDSLDGTPVIRLRIRKDDWHADYFIDTQTHRIVLKRTESDLLELPPDTNPSVGFLRFTSQREPTTEERAFTYTDEQHERAWKEAAVRTNMFAFALSKTQSAPTAEASQPAPEVKSPAPAVEPLPVGQNEIPANVDELLAKMDEAYRSPTMTVGKIVKETVIYGTLEQDPTPFELINNAHRLHRYSYNQAGYRRLLIGNAQARRVFSRVQDSLSYGSEVQVNRDVTEFTTFNPLLAMVLDGSARKAIFPEGTKFVSLDEVQNEGKRSLALVTVDGIRTRTYEIDRDTSRITSISMKPGVVKDERLRLPVHTIVYVTSERPLTTEEQTKIYDKTYTNEQWSEFQSFRFPKHELGPVLITGDRAPEFEGADIDGNPIKLSDYKNKVVLLSFWYVGCKPCINEMVHLKQLVNELKNPDLVVLTINIDTADDHATVVDRVKRCMAHFELDFPTILDEEQKIWDLYNADVLPTAVIIGRDGIIRGTLDRWDENSDEPIKAALGETESSDK